MVKLITPDKFVQYAKRIVSNPSSPEEEARSAVSRAYYSLYHETLQLMLRKYSFELIKNIEVDWKRPLTPREKYQLNSLDPVFLRRVNFHRVLPKTIYNLRKPIIATNFKNYRDKRNQADYDLGIDMFYSYANVIVSNIDGFIGIIKSVL
jgi:hypothetical protein